MRFASALAASLVLVAHASAALAQADDPFARGIDPIGTKLSLGLDSFLTVEGARTSPRGSYQLELALDYAEGLLALKIGQEKIGDLIERRVDLHLLGAYAVTEYLEVGLDLPITLYQKDGFGLLEQRTGFVDTTPAVAALGDLRVLGRLRLLSEEQLPVTVGAVMEVRLPTGAEESFAGEQGLQLAPRGVVERTFNDKLRLAFEAGYRLRTESGRYLNLFVGDEFALGLAASYPLPVTFVDDLRGYAELLAATPARAPFTVAASDALKTPLELLLGLRANLGRGFHALLGGGTGLSGESGYGRESFRLFGKLGFSAEDRDRDGDGIPDDEDKCPDVAEDLDGFEDADGCPEPDNDRDGIPDGEDRCPEVAGPKEYEGCPDSDGDEIPDHQDKCPKAHGPAQSEGCPPLTRPLVELEGDRLSLKDSVNFDTAQATIQPRSFPLLDEVSEVLRAHPELQKLRVEGHTDSVGAAPFNQDLSQRRAQAVVDYLVGKGIARGRFEARGYGEDRPIASNESALGRAKNRRVEFAILDEEPAPAPAPAPTSPTPSP